MNIPKILFCSIVLSLSMWLTPVTASAQGITVSFQVFYDELSPYGQWENDPDYGYVWSPNVTAFSPYSTNGYWVYTDYGWTWVSNYSWGWAPFHYGRWNHRPGHRWVWVPDNEWGPAWVQWRNSPGYYGWAPIGYGNDINYDNDYNRWNFVTYNNFGRHDIHNYYIPRTKNVVIIKNSTVLGGAGGPTIQEAQKQSGRTFNPVKVESYDKPGQVITKDKLNIYRPQVEKNGAGEKPTPAKVINPVNAGGMKPAQPKQVPSFNGGANTPKQQPANNAGGINKPKPNPANGNGGNNVPRQQPANNGGGFNKPQQQPANNGGGMNKPQMQQAPRQNSAPANKGAGNGKQPGK